MSDSASSSAMRQHLDDYTSISNTNHHFQNQLDSGTFNNDFDENRRFSSTKQRPFEPLSAVVASEFQNQDQVDVYSEEEDNFHHQYLVNKHSHP